MSNLTRNLPVVLSSATLRSVSSDQAFDRLTSFLEVEGSQATPSDLPHFEDICNISECLVSNNEQRRKLASIKSALSKNTTTSVVDAVATSEQANIEADEERREEEEIDTPAERISKREKKSRKKAEKAAKKAKKAAKKAAKQAKKDKRKRS